MLTTRTGSLAVVLGDALYMIGGFDSNVRLTSVERAIIAPTGARTAFASVSTHLIQGRSSAMTAVVGDKLYVLGGALTGDDVHTETIEVAAIAGRELDPFAMAPVSLTRPRRSAGVTILGDKLYVFGGLNHDGPVATVEVATIGADNSLGPFSTVPGLTATRCTAAALRALEWSSQPANVVP